MPILKPVINIKSYFVISLALAMIISGCSGSGSTPNKAPSDSNPGENTSNLVKVEFQITVPAYQSDELQLSLDWGDYTIVADWRVDESWVASASLPIDTSDQLAVTFSDRNGAITLGSVEQEFKTLSSATQSVTIKADQFDTNQWDDDADGLSNLAELISGSNPLASEASPNDPFTPDNINPLLADIQPGSPLSVTNYPVFLSAFYPLGGSVLLQDITSNMDAVSNEIRAALKGDASRFVAESVTDSIDANIMQADLACPGGGRVSVRISSEALDGHSSFTPGMYLDFRDQLNYSNCLVDGLTYNGSTTEHHANWNLTGLIVSRRYGGFVYEGAGSGANEFTDHPAGFGNNDEQFTVSNTRGVSATLYAQQSYANSNTDLNIQIQRWHGNWQLKQGDRYITLERVNIAVSKSGSGVSGDTVTNRVQPYFTITGNITNGRTITVFNQATLTADLQAGSLYLNMQSFSDPQGGILDLSRDAAKLDFSDPGVVLRIDTEGQVLSEILPETQEMLQLFMIK